jgi:5'(3')-deoxyribonucleotidase
MYYVFSDKLVSNQLQINIMMRIHELFEETESEPEQKMPHLYLDMDGVLADFFGSWAQQHGVSSYKDIPNSEVAINELANSSAEQVYQFFKDLKPLTGGMRIIMWLNDNNIPFTVLSAPLRGPFSSASIKAKKDWLDEYNPGTSSDAIFTAAKYKYATQNGEPNVLVDDYGKYLNAWSNAGGIAVKHEDSGVANTIRELEKIYGPFIHKT